MHCSQKAPVITFRFRRDLQDLQEQSDPQHVEIDCIDLVISSSGARHFASSETGMVSVGSCGRGVAGC